MTVYNGTDQTITVQNSGDTCWYANDLDNPKPIAPGTNAQIYTEMKNSGSCYSYINGSWVQGFKVMAGGNQIMNSIQNGDWDGKFGTCSISPQVGYSFQQASVGCEMSSSTITATFNITGINGSYSANVSSISCSGSLQCNLDTKR
ncbi:MAG: hypothetical protein INF97_14485 [Roseomonas sp.]|nr:hypothetical protein [Roseomonas sp.]